MFINDVNRKEEIRNIALQHLKKYGIKYRPKKPRPTSQVKRYGKKFFKVPLQNLETETVTLTNGQQLTIPKRIHEMCSYVLLKVETEGIFRKEGSKSRQNEIKLLLDRGCPLGDEHHVIDVAVVLKCFLRELPEPLIPQIYHELFLRCSIIENKLESILLACLLLPSENLNVLSYLMQFFYEVSSFSTYNKMTFSNLSILLGPNIFPIDEKMVPKSSLMITKICDITKILIENCRSIGVIPDNIIDQVGQLSDIENEKKRKNKRRSGSLTRMLNGLKKIVGGKTEEEAACPSAVPPDLLLTPTIHSFVRKRKADSGLSTKYNGKKNLEEVKSEVESRKDKRMDFNMRSSSMKNLKEDKSTLSSNNRRNSLGPKTMIERISSATFRKKRRHSSAAIPKKELSVAERLTAIKQEEPDYVRVSKKEYEELGNRVLAMERKLREFDTVDSLVDSDNDNNVNREIDISLENNIENVQTAYEKTLDTASLSPTTDQLARRLSRDLRIRRSIEQQVIRSPSARKIGTIRRKSSEREKKNAHVVRNQSWHVSSTVSTNGTAPLIPRISMRKKKNGAQETAVLNGNLQAHETPPLAQQAHLQRSTSFPKRSGRKAKNSLGRVSSPSTFTVQNRFIHQSSPQCAATINLSDSSVSHSVTYNTSGTSNDHWVSAEGYFSGVKTPQEGVSGNARASIAKLRSQNIGMVRAKARLFDNYKDSDTSCSSVQSSSRSQPGSANRKMINKSGSYKIGSPRSTESPRMSYRIKVLRSEERKNKKSNISPRRRHANVSQKQRLQHMGRQYVRNNKDNNSSMETTQDSLDFTTPRKDLNSLDSVILSPKKSSNPRNVPYIKMPLTVKTPKRLCRTPGVDRRTPFKVTATPL